MEKLGVLMQLSHLQTILVPGSPLSPPQPRHDEPRDLSRPRYHESEVLPRQTELLQAHTGRQSGRVGERVHQAEWF